MVSNEFAEYVVENNRRIEERARQEAWEEARALQKPQELLNARIAEAVRKYGPSVMGSQQSPPDEPDRSCQRSEIERYVRKLRAHCVATEKQLDRDVAVTERAIAQAWDEARDLEERHRSLNTRMERAVEQYGHEVRTTQSGLPDDPPRSCKRSEIEDYVRKLRVCCSAHERRLDDAVARAKRALDKAWKEAHALERRLERLEGRAQPLEARAPLKNRAQAPQRPAELSAPAEIQDYVARMKMHCAATENELNRSNIVAERSALLAEFGAQVECGITYGDDLFAEQDRSVGTDDAVPSPDLSRGDREDAAKSEGKRLLDRLRHAVSAEERGKLGQIAHSAVEAAVQNRPGRKRTLMLELQRGVQKANEGLAGDAETAAGLRDRLRGLDGNDVSRVAHQLAEVERGAISLSRDLAVRAESIGRCHEIAGERVGEETRDAERVAGLKEQLRGLDGDDVKRVVVEIAQIEQGKASLTPDFVAHAERVSASARAHADRAYAAEVMREEIERLGYEVGEKFEALVIKGGKTLVHKPDSGEYGVVVEVSGAEVHAEPVRIGESAAERSAQGQRRDQAFERACCKDFEQARAAMETRGVVGRVARRIPVGSRPIQVVGGDQVEASRERRRAGETRRRQQTRARHQRSH